MDWLASDTTLRGVAGALCVDDGNPTTRQTFSHVVKHALKLNTLLSHTLSLVQHVTTCQLLAKRSLERQHVPTVRVLVLFTAGECRPEL